MTWRANKGNYYYVRLYNETSSGYQEGASGYVAKSDCRTSYLGDTSNGYGRPWSNPYKAIYYGTKYVANSFKTQNSGYLQKFNVSPSSQNKYTNEYMKNVQGAASEAVMAYNGYEKAGILSMTRTFYIPIYQNMKDEISISVVRFRGTRLKMLQIIRFSIKMFTVIGLIMRLQPILPLHLLIFNLQAFSQLEFVHLLKKGRKHRGVTFSKSMLPQSQVKLQI